PRPAPAAPPVATPSPAAVPAPDPAAVAPSAPAPASAPASAPAPAPAAKPTPAGPPPVQQDSAPIGDAAYLHNPPPDYPDLAQANGWEGRVLLRVHVLADGHADSVAVLASSGRHVLDDAARDAVARWLFVPAKRGGAAIDGWVNVPLDFRLGQ
ncbi:MAG: energy transducer TonB, partial [Burkholderia sp.]